MGEEPWEWERIFKYYLWIIKRITCPNANSRENVLRLNKCTKVFGRTFNKRRKNQIVSTVGSKGYARMESRHREKNQNS